MQLLGTTIESWPDVQFVARQRDFRFTEIWNQRKELMKISHNEDFFTNDTVLGLTQEIKQNLFVYASSVFFKGEHNITSLLSLQKDNKDHYTFYIKKIIDGQSKPCCICDINFQSARLTNINSFLLELDKNSIPEEKIIAIACLLVLLSDGVGRVVEKDDTWIGKNRDDLRHVVGLKTLSNNESRICEYINKIYEDIRFESTSEFPLETRIFVNYGNEAITIYDGHKEWLLQSHSENRYDCLVGAFHGNKCYMMFENIGICSRSGKSLSLYFDHAESKVYLSIINNGQEFCIPDVVSFSCGEKDPIYILNDGEIKYGDDLFNEMLKIKSKLFLLEGDEKVLHLLIRNDNNVTNCITTKKIITL